VCSVRKKGFREKLGFVLFCFWFVIVVYFAVLECPWLECKLVVLVCLSVGLVCRVYWCFFAQDSYDCVMSTFCWIRLG